MTHVLAGAKRALVMEQTTSQISSDPVDLVANGKAARESLPPDCAG